MKETFLAFPLLMKDTFLAFLIWNKLFHLSLLAFFGAFLSKVNDGHGLSLIVFVPWVSSCKTWKSRHVTGSNNYRLGHLLLLFQPIFCRFGQCYNINDAVSSPTTKNSKFLRLKNLLVSLKIGLESLKFNCLRLDRHIFKEINVTKGLKTRSTKYYCNVVTLSF